MRPRHSARDIVVLSGLEAVRKNPWMYVGAVSAAGAHQLLFELVYNSVDEALAAGGSRIDVTLGGDRCRVADDGRGIPVEMHPHEGIAAAEVVLTKLHSGSKFSRTANRFAAGLHGVGLSCVNALSEWLSIEILRDGTRAVQRYRRGVPEHPMRLAGRSTGHGTTIEFWPDPKIFRDFELFDPIVCGRFLEDLSFLNPGIRFTLRTQATARARSFDHHSGLPGLLARMVEGARVLTPEPIAIRLDTKSLSLSAVLQWTTGREPSVRSFVNCVHTAHGGSHVSAVFTGATVAVNRVLLETGRHARGEDPAEVEEATEGLAAAVDLKLAHPNFEGQTKSRLTNADVFSPIERAVQAQLLGYMRKHPAVAAAVTDRILQARKARLAARQAAEKIYFQSVDRGVDEEVYKEQFGARSRNWHESAVWITHEKLLRAHAALCKKGKDAVALDVCCGSGVVGAAFRPKVKKVIGLDLTPEMVQLARARLHEVRQGNIYQLPFDDATFDLVCTREVLHLLPGPEKPVAEIFRVLKPGGQFIVGQTLPFSEDDAAWMFRIFKKKQPLVFNWFQEADFRRLLIGAGFGDLEMTEAHVWESIDVWIDSYETTKLHRQEIRQLYREAPAEARAVHPFEISPSGEIRDLWRWGIFSATKPIG